MAHMAEQSLSAQSRLHVYGILRQMFSDAVEYHGVLRTSPVMKRDRPKVHRTLREYLSPEESWKLLQASKGHYLGSAIWLALLSGLRTSEIQALRWSSVDFGKGHILIREAYKRGSKRIEPYPKQKDWGYAPMPSALCDYLQSIAGQAVQAGFVAPAFGGGMLEQKKFHNGLKKLCREAGVAEISPHGLRHSCTEIWVEHGANLEDLRRLLNHKTTETTRRYVHRSEGRLQQIAGEIELPKLRLEVVK